MTTLLSQVLAFDTLASTSLIFGEPVSSTQITTDLTGLSHPEHEEAIVTVFSTKGIRVGNLDQRFEERRYDRYLGTEGIDGESRTEISCEPTKRAGAVRSIATLDSGTKRYRALCDPRNLVFQTRFTPSLVNHIKRMIQTNNPNGGR